MSRDYGTSPWASERDDAVRGLASGFLVGIPVVFTVDSWWLGDQIEPLDALFLLGASYVLTLGAVYWIGFHRGMRRGWEHWADALEALAIAILALAVVFLVLGQIGSGQPLSATVGRIAVATLPVALGVAVANHFLPWDASPAEPDAGDATALRELQQGTPRSAWRQTLYEMTAAMAGALFLGLAIVPIDDLSAITTEVPAGNLPWVIALSLAGSYCVVFAAGFAGEKRRHRTPGPLQNPFTETIVAYLAAVVVSLVVLLLLGRITTDSPFFEVYQRSVLLAFPASMAAAAGRLAV